MNMSTSGVNQPFAADPSAAAGGTVLVGYADPHVPLLNFSTIRLSTDSVQQFLSRSLSSNTLLSKDQMDMVSTEIVPTIHQIIVNGSALMACSQNPSSDPEWEGSDPKVPVRSPINPSLVKQPEVELKNELKPDCEIVELDGVQLLAKHVHFCKICGKGFKREANLRMHTCVEVSRRTRFSCSFHGCNRNKMHKKFRTLKSVICVKDHFKRSHSPKMYSCNSCSKKSFSALADLKSHLKHCRESKWRCSCGTSFSRKDKLFRHLALFEGHMPAVAAGDEEKAS